MGIGLCGNDLLEKGSSLRSTAALTSYSKEVRLDEGV